MAEIYISERNLDRFKAVKQKMYQEMQREAMGEAIIVLTRKIKSPEDIKPDYVISYLLSKQGY